MRLANAVRIIEARTGYQYGAEASKKIGTHSARIIDGVSGRASGGGGILDYSLFDVERVVVWLRMQLYLGDIRNTGARAVLRLRRTAQASVPADHIPGWVVMSGGKAWFQENLPADLMLSGQGASAIRVHDDCDCT